MEESPKTENVRIQDLSQSVSFGPNMRPNILNSEAPDIPDYIDDFLQISPDAVFINGNTAETPRKKKIKKIVKKKIKKKINRNNNSVEIKKNDLKNIKLEEEKNKLSKEEKDNIFKLEKEKNI